MNSLTDQQLLVEYAEHHAEAAFSELVRRHIDLVHSAALRMVKDSHLAQDVTQSAFITLAKNASSLKDRPVLAGWLHGTARNLAANVVRSDVRRRNREQEAAAMNELISSAPDASWEQIAPQLDAALGELSEADRDAVMLRYFQRKSAEEMGEVLGVSAEAAQKRVSRAVDRLRDVLARNGASVGAGALITLVSVHAVQAAPAGLSMTVSAAATVAALAPTATTTAIATKTIAMTALQKTLVTATVVVLAGTGIYEATQVSGLRRQVTSLERQQAPLTNQVQQLQRERDETQARLLALQDERKENPNTSAELLRLRGMAGVARRATAEAEQLRAQLVQQTNQGPGNPVMDAMTDAMVKAMSRRADGQLARMTATLHLTPTQAQAAREILNRQAQAMSAGMKQAMTGKYNRDELTNLGKKAGSVDDQIKALLTPEQQSLYSTYKQEEMAQDASLAANQELLQMQSTLRLTPEQLDGVYAALYQVTVEQLNGSNKQQFTNEAQAMEWAMQHKAQALAPLLTEPQMEILRQEQEQQTKLVRDIMSKLESARGGK